MERDGKGWNSYTSKRNVTKFMADGWWFVLINALKLSRTMDIHSFGKKKELDINTLRIVTTNKIDWKLQTALAYLQHHETTQADVKVLCVD